MDGVLLGNLGEARIGGILHDHGSPVKIKSLKFVGVDDFNLAKLKGITNEAFFIFVDHMQHKHVNLWIEIDSKNVVLWITNLYHIMHTFQKRNNKNNNC